VIRFSVFEADLRTGELRRKGVKIKIQEQPFRVLAALLKRPGELVTREELHQEIWPEDVFVDFEQGLNNAVKKLRLAIDDSAETPRFVETLARRGYRFIASVNALPAEAPVPLKPSRAPRPAWLVLALTVAAVVFLVRQRPWSRVPAPPGRVTLAVLPFVNLSGDPGQEYFSDGMTEEMISQLGRLHPAGLDVIARASAMHYKGTNKRTDEVGRELGVDYILSGSVRRAERQVRVTAALVRAKDQVQVWSGSFDREQQSVLEAQSEVARAIAREIPVGLTPRERSLLPRARPVAPEAYEAYLQGLYFFNKFSVETEKKAIAFFEEAIRHDPSYAPAYAGMGNAYQFLAVIVAPFPEALPRARAAVAKALELDPTLDRAHAVAGWLSLMSEWDFPQAEKEFKHAIELNPSLATAHQGYSMFLAAMGRLPESMAEIERARQLDPLSLIINADIGTVLYYSRHHDQAIAQCRKTLDLDPRFGPLHWQLSYAYQAKGMYGQAVDEWLEARRLMFGDSAWYPALRQAFTTSGWRGYQKKRLEAMRDLRSREGGGAGIIADAYIQLGKTDAAFDWLDRSIEERSWHVVFLKVNPVYDPLRQDPRFKELLRRIGLPS
jgi:TolB-like protein/DNA-binding winged helix-turn-helix (wHTH) protein/Tfp pilus assembly protein PilF